MTDTPARAESGSMDKDAYEKSIRYLFIYTLLIALVLSSLAVFAYFMVEDCIIRIMMYVGCSGGLGGVVYSILGYTSHLVKGDFDLKYSSWYFFRPITAGILGLFSFFLVAGGLMTLSGTPNDLSPATCFSMKSVMFYMALSFMTGYANNAFIKKLNDIAGTIFKSEGDSEKPPPRQEP